MRQTVDGKVIAWCISWKLFAHCFHNHSKFSYLLATLCGKPVGRTFILIFLLIFLNVHAKNTVLVVSATKDNPDHVVECDFCFGFA